MTAVIKFRPLDDDALDDLTIPDCMPEDLQDKATVTDAVQTTGDNSSDEAECWAFMGAAGGVGTTSLAIQTAYELAERVAAETPAKIKRTEPKVCLVDLDFELGTCAHYLDLPPSLNMEDLQDVPERIDRALTTALMSAHDSGIALLAAPNKLGGNDSVNPETVLAILDQACQIYDHVVLDVPRLWRPWTHAAIAASDHFGLVTELTIPTLHLTRARAKDIENNVEMRATMDIILNKYERRSFRNSLRLKDAEAALERTVNLTICVDSETTKEAINCGEPVSVVRPESRYVKDVKKLMTHWQGEPQEQKRKLFG